MKWKGTVSHSPKTSMATRLRQANAPHATSIQYLRNGHCHPSRIDAIPSPANRLDQLRSKLGPETPNVYVHNVGPGIEMVAPDRVEQAFLRDRPPRLLHELLKEQELPFGERHRAGPGLGLPADHVEREEPGG